MFWQNKKSEPAAESQTSETAAGVAAGAANAPPTAIPYSFDPKQLHPMANLGGPIEFLELPSNSMRADGLIASRGWSEGMSYGVGAMYLLGLATGGTYGFLEAMRTTSDKMPTKLRINAILNAVTRRGPYVGNNAGIVTIMYNVNAWLVDTARGGKQDDAGTVAAGALTGGLYRINTGARGVAYASLFGAGAAGAWCAIKRLAQPQEDEF